MFSRKTHTAIPSSDDDGITEASSGPGSGSGAAKLHSSPTLLSNLFFPGLYVSLWVVQTLLIKSAQVAGAYAFDVFAMTLLTEAVKFVLTFLYFSFFEGEAPSVSNTIRTLRSSSHMGVKYCIPACIYSVYNVLVFVNLLAFDPGVYRVLINIRVVTSGLLFQFFFGKQLGQRKWIALLILTFGCAIAKYESFYLDSAWPLVVLLFQAGLSSLGGVSNEFLFKNEPSVHFAVQNMWLYGMGTLSNLITAMIIRGPDSVLSGSLFNGFGTTAAVIVFFSALGGFSTSFLLKFMSVIAKEFANGVEMVFVAVASHFLFDTPLQANLLVSIACVWIALYTFNTAT
eukprot:ANDGO_05685.mRNA.1 CMP-sialic acid transporter 2